MRQGFTLIELMIVIAIIAIIAAIAIPNLLESRITANEAQAATSLKSAVFPGQVQYQNGGYIDVDNDGRGVYAAHPSFMAGTTSATTGSLITAPAKALQLLPNAYNVAGGATAAAVSGGQTAALASARVGVYDYSFTIPTTEDDAETYWLGLAVPSTTTGNEARRAFGVAANGAVYQTKGTLTQANTTLAYLTASSTGMFSAGLTSQASPNFATATPYQK